MEVRNLLAAGLAGAALTFSFAPGAEAATKTFSTSTGSVNASLLPSTLTLNKFDTSLGTLTAAQLTLSLTNLASVTATNGSTTTDFTLKSAKSTVDITVQLTSPSLSLEAIANATATGLPTTLAKNSSLDFKGITKTVTPVSLSLDAGQMTAFSGTGGSTITLDLLSDIGVSGSSDDTGSFVSFSGSSFANVGLSITYTYTIQENPNPAPEPASIMLLGASIAGVAAFRRRRRAE